MTPPSMSSQSSVASPTSTSVSSPQSGVWIFGYGSLIWRPEFRFIESRVGFIKGFVRRFWQGSDTHRGRPERVGRVVTLVEDDPESETWGRAFRLPYDSKTEHEVKKYLNHRECGYTTMSMRFHSIDPSQQPVIVLVYVALPTNPHYLGPAPLSVIARDIVESEGTIGHNVEYLVKIDEFVRKFVPSERHHHDRHLEQLMNLVSKMVDGQPIRYRPLRRFFGHRAQHRQRSQHS